MVSRPSPPFHPPKTVNRYLLSCMRYGNMETSEKSLPGVMTMLQITVYKRGDAFRVVAGEHVPHANLASYRVTVYGAAVQAVIRDIMQE